MRETLQEKTSPMMQQWSLCKRSCPGALLLFRMGDFYEAFDGDAATLAQELSITLTQRQSTPMAGVPAVALEGALEKLSSRGLLVAVAEQMQDPKQTKGLVERQVVRVISPGTFTPAHDTGREHPWVVSVNLGPQLALAACDVTTCELWVADFDTLAELEAELCRLRPKELLVSSAVLGKEGGKASEFLKGFDSFCTSLEAHFFDFETAHQRLKSHFHVHSADSLGLKDLPSCVESAGALITYLQQSLRLPLEGLQTIRLLPKEGIMQIDRHSQRNLEIVHPLFEGQNQSTLLRQIDCTQTPMGARLLRHWLIRPLCHPQAIVQRAGAVAQMKEHPPVLDALRSSLSRVRDLQRLAIKLISGQLAPRDLLALRSSLQVLPELLDLFKGLEERAQGLEGLWLPISRELAGALVDLQRAQALLERAVGDEVAARVGEGPIIRAGYHEELDQLRDLRSRGQQWLSQYQEDLREKLGIKSLKVGYTPAFGYYIEVSKGQSALMPSSFSRRQTLVSSERYLSSQLKVFEERALHAQERSETLERELLEALGRELVPLGGALENASHALAQADCLLCLAHVAHARGYVRPQIDDSDELLIIGGRHPVVERILGRDRFIANQTRMGAEEGRMMLITGPNMAGKSTYIRQVALLVLLAQIGSFVPAESMRLGVVDRIFTRVGASDDLSRGQSTFMVEMSETANILHQATDRSLVILDEVGRGTSTYDGIAIARAVAEFLLTEPNKKAKTLFATHYSELTDLPLHFPAARNYRVAVREWEGELIFLHQIVEGAADRSYGLHVARLAGLPPWVIARAEAIQEGLEGLQPSQKPPSVAFTDSCQSGPSSQLQPLAPLLHPRERERLETVAALMETIEVNQLTPMEALIQLDRLVQAWRATSRTPS